MNWSWIFIINFVSCSRIIRRGSFLGTSFLLGSVLYGGIPNKNFAHGAIRDKKKKEDKSWLNHLFGKSTPDLQSIDFNDVFERVSQSTQAVIQHETFGKLSYGFLMGYASGYCVKKVIILGIQFSCNWISSRCLA